MSDPPSSGANGSRPTAATRAFSVLRSWVMGVEFEWNPFSAASRAAQAEEKGRIEEAIHLYIRARKYDQVPRCLQRSLPSGAIGQVLVDGADAWLRFQRCLREPRVQRLPEPSVSWMTQEAETAANRLWDIADRVMAVSPHALDDPEVLKRLDAMAQALQPLIEAFRDARTELVLALLSNGRDSEALRESAERAGDRLRTAAQTVGDVSRELWEE